MYLVLYQSLPKCHEVACLLMFLDISTDMTDTIVYNYFIIIIFMLYCHTRINIQNIISTCHLPL